VASIGRRTTRSPRRVGLSANVAILRVCQSGTAERHRVSGCGGAGTASPCHREPPPSARPSPRSTSTA
jgi:hypothetical protein